MVCYHSSYIGMYVCTYAHKMAWHIHVGDSASVAPGQQWTCKLTTTSCFGVYFPT
jgi:hypothetical protein